MSVQEKLKHCLIMYPTIFENRWDVFHHWFIVNGNGYDWVNGQLVDFMDLDCHVEIENGIRKIDEQESLDEKRDLSELERFAVKVRDVDEGKWGEVLRKSRIERNEKHRNMVRNWEQRSKDFTCTRTKGRNLIYPICEFAQIMNIPDNIQPDWKEAVLEMYNWLLEHKDEIGEKNVKYVNQIKIP